MAKGVGLDIGEHEVKAVELEGSYRKPRLAKVSIEPVLASDGEGPEAVEAAESALAALREAKMARENVFLGFGCRHAVLRTMRVPFRGEDAIRKVIKFEAENQIHSHNVDDMVVDFRPIADVEDETRVLVAAVPKPRLRVTLEALDRNGLEPEIVDLDAMALFRAAQWAGVLDDAPAGTEHEDSEEATRPTEKPSQLTRLSARSRLLVDVGARSTGLVVVVDGRPVDIRALRLGTDSIASDVARACGVTMHDARRAVRACLSSGEDFVVVEDDEEVEAAAGDEPDVEAALPGEAVLPGEDVDVEAVEPDAAAEGETALATRPEEVSHELVVQARDRFLTRLRRELLRTTAAVPELEHCERLFVTGGGSAVVGVPEVFGEVFGVEPRELDLLSKLAHNLDADEAADLSRRLPVAIGLALGSLGGPRGFNFRREELAFTRQFDRIKFPLAILTMAFAFLVVVYTVWRQKEVKALRQEIGVAVYDPERPNELPQFTGYVGKLVNRGSSFANPESFPSKLYREQLVPALVEAEPKDRVKILYSQLDRYLKDRQAESGIYTGLEVDSGYSVFVRFAQVLEAVRPVLAPSEDERFAIGRLSLDMSQRGSRKRTFQFDLIVRGDFVGKVVELRRRFQQDAADPCSPFTERVEESQVQTWGEAAVPAAKFTFQIELKDAFQVCND